MDEDKATEELLEGFRKKIHDIYHSSGTDKDEAEKSAISYVKRNLNGGPMSENLKIVWVKSQDEFPEKYIDGTLTTKDDILTALPFIAIAFGFESAIEEGKTDGLENSIITYKQYLKKHNLGDDYSEGVKGIFTLYMNIAGICVNVAVDSDINLVITLIEKPSDNDKKSPILPLPKISLKI